MISDTDLIGIISASCILFVFICGFTVCVAWVCRRRLETKRKKEAVRTAVLRRKKREASRNVVDFPSGGSMSESVSEAPRKMSSYRPKILAKSHLSSLSEISSRDSSESEDKRRRRPQKHVHSSENEAETTRRKAVSVIYVNGSDNNRNSGHVTRDFKVNGHVTEGHITVSHNGKMSQSVRTETANEYTQYRNNVTATLGHVAHRAEGEVSQAQIHQSMPSSGAIVRGHIIKQTVAMGVDGHLLVTGSEQRDLSDVTLKRQSSDIHAIVTSGAVEYSREHSITESVNVDEGRRLFSKTSEVLDQDDAVESSIEIVEIGATSNRPRTVVEEAVSSVHYDGSSSGGFQDEVKVERQDLRGLLITEDHVADDWVNADDEAVREYEKAHQAPAVVLTADTSAREVDERSSVVQGRPDEDQNFALISRHMQDDVDFSGSRRQDDSISMFYSDSKNYKVIKKHSAHKPPDWLVQTYAEAATSADVVHGQRESITQSVQTVEASVLTTTSSLEYHKDGPKVSFGGTTTHGHDSDTARLSWISAEDSEMEYPEPDYPQDDESFTLTEFIDQDNNAAGRVMRKTFSEVQTSDDGTITTTRTMTATAMRQVRHDLNEAQEQLPLAFKSPKASWEIPGPADSSNLMTLVTSQRRQSRTEIVTESYASPAVIDIT